jgi:hypothetical protein
LVVSVLTALFAPWYWRITGLIFTGFFAWFIPHIWNAEGEQITVGEYNILSPYGVMKFLAYNMFRSK